MRGTASPSGDLLLAFPLQTTAGASAALAGWAAQKVETPAGEAQGSGGTSTSSPPQNPPPPPARAASPVLGGQAVFQRMDSRISTELAGGP